jgi:hypothetical protein
MDLGTVAPRQLVNTHILFKSPSGEHLGGVSVMRPATHPAPPRPQYRAQQPTVSRRCCTMALVLARPRCQLATERCPFYLHIVFRARVCACVSRCGSLRP